MKGSTFISNIIYTISLLLHYCFTLYLFGYALMWMRIIPNYYIFTNESLVVFIVALELLLSNMRSRLLQQYTLQLARKFDTLEELVLNIDAVIENAVEDLYNTKNDETIKE